MTKIVYKVCSTEAWDGALSTGFFDGSPDDCRDGFIHLSILDQIPGTLRKHFAGQDRLVLVALNAAELADKLKWEASASGQIYPHYYGRLPTTAALRIHPLPRDDAGHHILPGDLDRC